MATHTVHFDTGVTYRGRLEAFAPSIIGKDYIGGKVKEKLGEQGFTNVNVWMVPSALPADWPSEARADVSGSGHTQAWLEGTWSKPSGDYPSSGSNWQVVDYWEQSLPATPDANTCYGAGYTCDPSLPAGLPPCCPGNTCGPDTANVYGGGNRCMPSGPVSLNKPKPGITVLGYLFYTAVIAGAVWAGWSYGLPAIGLRSKKNPSGDRWEIRVNDRRVQWSQQTYNRLFGKDKNSAVIEAATADEAFAIFSDMHKPGLNRYYFAVFPAGTAFKMPH